MTQPKEFYAFISYKREDEKWAKWLQDKLEHYKFPTNLNGRTDLPKHIRPTFRDVTDLKPGLLAEEINNALRNSEWLIVVCSPRSAKSPWVCKEAQTFIDLGRADHIIPFVIEGNPFSNDPATECYPDALLSLTGSQELLAANINEMGRDAAAIKVVARMFNLRFDSLWQRYEREQKKIQRIKMSIISICLLVAVGITGWIVHQNGLLKEKDWKMMENQARAVAEKANHLIDEGDSYLARLLAVEILPKDLQHPNRPYTVEAEAVLRKAWACGDAIFHGHTTNAMAVAFSPDDKYIVSGSTDNTIRVWDVQTGLCVDTLLGHTGMVDYVSYSPDGMKIISSARDSTARLWDVSNSSCLRTLKNAIRPVRSVFFMDLGQKAVFSREGMVVTFWNLTNGKSRDCTLQPYGFFRYAPLYCEKDAIIAVSGSNQIKMMSLESKVLLQSLECDFEVKCLCVNSTGEVLVAMSEDEEAVIWNLKEGKCLHKLKGYRDFRMPPVLSSDGSLLAMLSHYGVMNIVDVKTGKLIKEINQTLRFDFERASFSHDNSYISAACTDGTIRIWETGAHNSAVYGYVGNDDVFPDESSQKDRVESPDGKYEARINDDNSMRVIEISDSTNVKNLSGHNAIITSMVFSPDGKLLASSSLDATIRLWDVQSGECIRQLKENNFAVNCVQFSSDGKKLVSHSGDYGTIRVWDISTGYCLFQTKGMPMVRNLCFTNGDRQIVFKSYGQLNAIDFPPLQELIDQTRERFKNRQLTPEERRKYYLE